MNGRLVGSLLLLALVAVTAIAGLTESGSGDPNLVKIVSSLPRTGSAKAQTDTIVDGIKLALAEAEWQAGPFKLEFADWDDATAAAAQWTAEAEIANARRAVRNPDVMVYIGTYNSGAAKVSMPILNQAGVLMISPANTWPGLTKPDWGGDPGEPFIYRPAGKVNYVRVVSTDDLQAALSAAWAQEMGVRRVWVLDDNEVYGKGIANLFIGACGQIGIDVLGTESIDVKAQEFKSLFTMIKADRPDLVYFGGTTQSKGGQIAKDMVAVGLDAKLMVPDACFEKAFIDSAGVDNLVGRCYVTFPGLPISQWTGGAQRFLDKYRQTYGKEPEAYAIYGYEAGKLAVEAIRRAGRKDRQAIVEACLAIRDFAGGALAAWSLDANGDTTRSTFSGMIVTRGQNGEGDFEFVKLLEKK